MRLLVVRAAVAAIAVFLPAAANAGTFYGYCTDSEHSNVISSFFTFEGDSGDYDEIKDQWEEAVSAQLGIETYQIRGSCYASSDRAKSETSYNNILGYTEEYLIPFAPKSQERAASPSKEPKAPRERTEETANTKPTEREKSAAQVATEEAAARNAKYDAEFQAKQAEYERKLADQQKAVDDYKKAQNEVERTKAANQAKAEEAAAKFKAEQEAYAETARQHAEREAAAQKLLEDWDARHGLIKKSQPSTSTDANRCVTSPQLQSNASFKGNTAASVINGCGEPIDVRICLMTTKGWSCGATWGLESQAKWSWSSFDATGQVFVDAHVSSSPRAFASPQ